MGAVSSEGILVNAAAGSRDPDDGQGAIEERLAKLTRGQLDCLLLVDQHLSSKEISAELNISPHTVDQRIRVALQTISPIQREAIELAFFGGLTQVEVAARTGAPLGTVKSRMRLGLLGLRRALEEPGEMGEGPEAGEPRRG